MFSPLSFEMLPRLQQYLQFKSIYLSLQALRLPNIYNWSQFTYLVNLPPFLKILVFNSLQLTIKLSRPFSNQLNSIKTHSHVCKVPLVTNKLIHNLMNALIKHSIVIGISHFIFNQKNIVNKLTCLVGWV